MPHLIGDRHSAGCHRSTARTKTAQVPGARQQRPGLMIGQQPDPERETQRGEAVGEPVAPGRPRPLSGAPAGQRVATIMAAARTSSTIAMSRHRVTLLS